ncbi:MAG: asparagine synthase (glutamine-hydrolyzing) [Thermoanaerobaculum sp.]|nr:asparagine synthase (glutamine-hydrolyzing) [Thermoanaerobaculum sp.]MDW7967034.1 asparagine synthase (glutamine-hydrolyzing) [Thermoanaerobaculum sp.]
MCGIFGFAGRRITCSQEEVKLALSLLRHRGPDALGLRAGPGWALGACRLAILDLVAGDQPVSNEAGQIHAVFNGEIYNYRPLQQALRKNGHRLRSSGDTELLVHLWEEQGRGMLQSLRGMFALALVDERTHKLFLARDPVGKKPLYWMRAYGGLFFASELKALRPFAPSWSVDPQALGQFLTFGFVPEGACFITGVEKLPPGHWLELDIPTGEIRTGTHFEFHFAVDPGLPRHAAASQLLELLGEATALRLQADVPVALFLSGGLDSATVAALAARVGEVPRLLFVDLGDAGERRRAEATAASLQRPLEVLPGQGAPDLALLPRLAEVFDEPLADPSVVPTLFVAQAAATAAKVVLNGDGGDELLAGYRRFLLAHAASHPATGLALKAALGLGGRLLGRHWWWHRMSGSVGDPAHDYLVWGPVKFTPREVGQIFWEKPDLSTFEEVVRRAPRDSIINCLRALELWFFLPGDLLVKMDRATMACSVEARSPFLDREVVQFLLTVPPQYLLAGWRTKSLLREATKALLPRSVRRGPKRGFEPPLGQWLAGPWREAVDQLFHDPGARLRSFIRMGPLGQLLPSLALQDPPRHARALFTLLTLEHWLRRWN